LRESLWLPRFVFVDSNALELGLSSFGDCLPGAFAVKLIAPRNRNGDTPFAIRMAYEAFSVCPKVAEEGRGDPPVFSVRSCPPPD